MKLFKKVFTTLALTTALVVSTPSAFGFPGEICTVEAAAKISKKSATIMKGKTLKLKISGTSKKVSWSTKNKKVATVSKSGVVTAKKGGTTTIVAKVGAKKFSCKITVKEKSGKITNKYSDWTDETMAALGIVRLKECLKDPSSLIVNRIKIGYEDQTYGDIKIKNVQTVFVDFSAANSYGVNIRKYATFSLYPKSGKPFDYIVHKSMMPGTYLTIDTYSNPSYVTLKKSKSLSTSTVMDKVSELWDEGDYKIKRTFY